MSKQLHHDIYERMDREEKRLAWEYLESQYEKIKDATNTCKTTK